VLPSASGAPIVKLHGYPQQAATSLGVTDVYLTISHTGDHAIAQAIVRRRPPKSI